MREYGQIQCSFWTDPDIQGLSDQARSLACYLLTGPHSNGLGCYRLPDGYIQADFGWTSQTVSKGFGELFEIGFCNRCASTQFVLIPKFLKWNPVANPKVAIAREREFRAVPKKSAVYQQLAESMSKHGNHWSEGFANHIETVSKRYAKQDPTQPDPNQNQTRPESLSSGKPDHSAAIRSVFAHWQERCEHPRAKLDDKRKRLIRARLQDGYTVDDLTKAIDGCARSPFHQGDNKDGKVYDGLDLICRDGAHVDQFLKIADDPDTGGMSSHGRKTAAAAREFLGE